MGHNFHEYYSWIDPNEGVKISSAPIVGSLSILLTITSTGEMVVSYKQGTVKSEVFVQHILVALNQIGELGGSSQAKPLVILDGARYHTS